MPRNGSASASERLVACPGYLAFPHVYRTSTASARGTGLHAFVARVVAGTPPADALAFVPEDDRPTAALIDWGRLLGGLSDVRAEVAYALDARARTARWIGNDVGRAYDEAAEAHGGPLGEWEVPGSLDITGVDGAGRVVVIDVKSGFRQVTEAEVNGQLTFFAACRMLLDGVDEVEVRIAKLKTSGAIYDGDRAVIERFDAEEWLDAYAVALGYAKAAQRAYAEGVVPDVSEGDHCGFCPAFDSCPAKHALVRSALPELAGIDARVAALSSEDAGAAYDLCKRIEAAVERVLGPLKERVHREGSLPLPGGQKVVKSIQSSSARFSQSLARGLLVQLGATGDQIARCNETSTYPKVMTVNAPGVGKAPRLRKPKAAPALPPAAPDPPALPADEEYPF